MRLALWYCAVAAVACSVPGADDPIDLVHGFGTAEKRSVMPLDQAFAVKNVTINGETKVSLFAHPPSRIVWKVVMPRSAVLRTAMGILPEAWEQDGDGVTFRIGISDERVYEELWRQHVHPAASPADRGWLPVTVDLSRYGDRQWSLFYHPTGREWNLILSTDPGPPGSADSRWDWAVWGAPVISGR